MRQYNNRRDYQQQQHPDNRQQRYHNSNKRGGGGGPGNRYNNRDSSYNHHQQREDPTTEPSEGSNATDESKQQRRERSFFILKCNNEKNMSISFNRHIWATTKSNEKRLARAFKECQEVGLFYYFSCKRVLRNHIWWENFDFDHLIPPDFRLDIRV